MRTSDINLAAYLMCKGVPLKDVVLVGKHKGEFVFGPVDQALIDEFAFGRASVEPVLFNMSVRRLSTSVKDKVKQQNEQASTVPNKQGSSRSSEEGQKEEGDD